jgi:hypothetical protein
MTHHYRHRLNAGESTRVSRVFSTAVQQLGGAARSVESVATTLRWLFWKVSNAFGGPSGKTLSVGHCGVPNTVINRLLTQDLYLLQ